MSSVLARIKPTGFGYDTSEQPPGGDQILKSGSSVTASVALVVHQWFLDHTNLRFAGGYITKDVWGRHFEEIWQLGFGLTLFDNHDVGGSDDTGWSKTRFFKTHSFASGQAEARGILERAHGSIGRIKRFGRAIVYVDNEDANANVDMDFYRGIFEFLEKQGPDSVRIRPGFYGKPWLFDGKSFPGFLSEFPYLYFCEATYPRSAHLSDSDSRRAPFKPMPGKENFNWPFFDIPDSNPRNVTWEPAYTDSRSNTGLYFNPHGMNALPPKITPRLRKPAENGKRGPKKPWLEWPVIYQFEGSNMTIPALGNQSATIAGTPYGFNFSSFYSGADFESSVVDDPAYPSASPRLALSKNAPRFLARLDRVEPPNSGKRRGHIQIGPYSQSADKFGSFWEPTSSSLNQSFPIAPGVRPSWTSSQGGLVLIIPRRENFSLRFEIMPLLATSEMSDSPRPVSGGLTIMEPPGRKLPVHTPFGATSFNDEYIHLFVVADDGSLLTTRGRPMDSKWPDLALHAEKIVHPYSQLTVCTRGVRGRNGFSGQDVSVDTFFIGPDMALHTAWWNITSSWPSRQHQKIGNPEVLLPTTNLSAVSPDVNTIFVFGTGFDLLLHVAIWKPSGWTGPYQLGSDDELLAAHGDISACWNSQTHKCEIVAVANDLSLLHYQFDYLTGTDPRPLSATKIYTTDVSQPVTNTAVNPFGDVVLSIFDRRVVAAVFVDDGKSVAKWKSSDAKKEVDPSATTDFWSDWRNL
jgi:hypothetical protein